MLTIFAHYMCLHGCIHFIYLFNPNTKYQDMYHIPQISQKDRDLHFCSYCPVLLLKKRAFGHILLDAPCCGLRREAKIFFFLTEFLPFKFEYNSHFDNILVKKLNLVFQPMQRFALECGYLF